MLEPNRTQNAIVVMKLQQKLLQKERAIDHVVVTASKFVVDIGECMYIMYSVSSTDSKNIEISEMTIT